MFKFLFLEFSTRDKSTTSDFLYFLSVFICKLITANRTSCHHFVNLLHLNNKQVFNPYLGHHPRNLTSICNVQYVQFMTTKSKDHSMLECETAYKSREVQTYRSDHISPDSS